MESNGDGLFNTLWVVGVESVGSKTLWVSFNHELLVGFEGLFLDSLGDRGFNVLTVGDGGLDVALGVIKLPELFESDGSSQEHSISSLEWAV